MEGCVAKKKKPTRKRVDSPFSKNLANVLGERGLTQRQAASLAEVSQATIADWLAGAMPADPRAVQKLCRALNVSFEFILTGEMSEVDSSNLTLAELFEAEDEAMFSGIFEISARRLKRRGDSND